MYTILVLGGYGNFGQIISRALAADARMRVIVGGRDGGTADAFARSLGNAESARVDTAEPGLGATLTRLRVDALVHTAGPFQAQDYRVARACVEAACHYIDLADGRDFVCGISALDGPARAQGVLVASGASSVPSLAAAVVDSLLPEFAELHEIRHAISSSGKTPGRATVSGVLAGCGRAFQRFEQGRWKTVHGMQGLEARRFPAPLGLRLLGNMDVPDLQIFPARYPAVRSVVFKAGLGPPLRHLGTWVLSLFARSGLLRAPEHLADRLRAASVRLEPWSTRDSGMMVSLAGTRHDGSSHRRTWWLLARDDLGVHIPCLPALALVRALAAGTVTARGAQPCVGLASLRDMLDALPGLDLEESVT